MQFTLQSSIVIAVQVFELNALYSFFIGSLFCMMRLLITQLNNIGLQDYSVADSNNILYNDNILLHVVLRLEDEGGFIGLVMTVF